MASLGQRLTASFLCRLPARALGRLFYRLSRSRRKWLKNRLINGFVWLYAVETSDAELPIPSGYATFNDFFTRRLRPGTRPVDRNPDTVCSPADGGLAGVGTMDGTTLIQAKGINYSLSDLLGNNPEWTTRLAGGSYATVYLAPWNYHRVHMPLAGRLRQAIFVPGRLYSVNAATTACVPNLYTRNERLVCCFDSPRGPFALILVGATNVASITTAWAGEVAPRTPNVRQDWHYDEKRGDLEFKRGDCMGQFNMGSTVVLVAGPGVVEWDSGTQPGYLVRVGQRIGMAGSIKTA